MGTLEAQFDLYPCSEEQSNIALHNTVREDDRFGNFLTALE